ncbi:MAG TPA: hypothetical protein VIM11_00525 [Tepidisphaeraceae bacterium]
MVTPRAGDWQTFSLLSGSSSSIFQNVKIEYAGNANNPGDTNWLRTAVVIDSSAAQFQNIQVLNSDVTAIRIQNGSNPVLTNVDVEGSAHGGIPFSMDFSSNPALTNITSSGNGFEAVVIDGGTLPGDREWNLTTLPYVLGGNVVVPQNVILKIDPGAVVKLTSGQLFTINGTLSAAGTTLAPITFTSRRDQSVFGDTFHAGPQTPATGDWQAINLLAGSDASVLQNVLIDYAGNLNTPGDTNWLRNSLLLDHTTAHLQNVRVLNGDVTGIRIQNVATGTLDHVDVENSAHGGVPFSMDLASNPALSNLTESGNGIDAFYLDGGTIPANREWNVTNMPYMLNASMTVPAGLTLTLDPGVVVKMATGQLFTVNGTLSAASTPATSTTPATRTGGGRLLI